MIIFLLRKELWHSICVLKQSTAIVHYFLHVAQNIGLVLNTLVSLNLQHQNICMPVLHYVVTHPLAVFVVFQLLINKCPLFSAKSCFLSPSLILVSSQMFNHCSVSLYNIGLHSKKQVGDGHV